MVAEVPVCTLALQRKYVLRFGQYLVMPVHHMVQRREYVMKFGQRLLMPVHQLVKCGGATTQ